ncbi:MAG: RNA-binding domain-containing protein [Anaerolineae bacterium]
MASSDWREPGATWLDWLYKCEQRGLDVVAITDHNTVAGVAQLRREIERLQWLEAENRLRPQERRELDEYRRLGEKILVLPGFEFTATFGFHVLGIFPPETSVRQLEHILLDLHVPADRLDNGSTEVGATTDVLTAYRIIRQAGGLVIAAHANSTHGVAMREFPFGGQTKIAYTQDANLHALEVTDLESRSTRATARFFDGSKPEYPRRMRAIQGSDAHRLTSDVNDKNRLGIGERVIEVKLSGPPSFRALKAVFESNDFTLTRPYRRKDEPFDHVTAAREQGANIVQAFHERVTRQGGRLFTVLSDVVAFANTHGGTVYIGAGINPGPPLGVEDPEQTITELRTEIQNKILPPLDVILDTLETQGQRIVRIQVPEGLDKPYCLDDSRIYLRIESDSVQAVRDEIVRLVRQALLARGEVVEPARAAAPVAVEPAKSKSRSKRGGSKQPATSSPAEAVMPVVQPAVAAAPVVVPEEEHLLEELAGVQPPKVGVQIVDARERGGVRYYTIRDLRNGSLVQNVTLKSARRLWRYAISQHEQGALKPDVIRWVGDVGLVRMEKRAGKHRYDFAQRLPDGSIAIYYGVTEEGCEGVWRQFMVEQDEPEGALAYEFAE